MRPWASWTAKTVLLAAGFAAAGGGLSGVALADTGGGAAGQVPALGGSQLAPAVIPAVCGEAAAVLGDSTLGCAGAAAAGSTAGQPASGTASQPSSGTVSQPSSGTASQPAAGTSGGPAGTAIQRAAGPVSATIGAAGPLAGLQPVSGLSGLDGAPDHAHLLAGPTRQAAVAGGTGAARGGPGSALGLLGAGGVPAPGRSHDAPGSGQGAGTTDVPTAAQLVGLGALRGLADLPSPAGPATMPALKGVTGGGIPIPGTALSAANAPGMSSDSFAALAVGSLLAGASALKIAGRRARDRKAGIGVAT